MVASPSHGLTASVLLDEPGTHARSGMVGARGDRIPRDPHRRPAVTRSSRTWSLFCILLRRGVGHHGGDHQRRRGLQIRSLVSVTVVLAAFAIGGCGTEEERGDDGGRQTETRPLVGTYVGTVSDSDVYIALNSDGTQVGGYLSDGQQVSIWLATSDLDDGRAELMARGDRARLGEAVLGPQSASGTVEIGGLEHAFSAAPATGEAGLYRKVEGAPGQPGFEETGWIVLSDGSEKGSTTITDGAGNTRIVPAPERTTQPKWTDPTTDM